ncbi:MAG: alpha/beta hydrolase [Bryobacteraceae bacterium]|jgi:pimeloyl-ACP methyl ester carboxylesterase
MIGVIYLHGFASSPNSRKAIYFRRQLEAIGASVEVPDLAQGDFEHLTISGQLSVLEEIAAGRPVALMGSSLGGYLAALYAARHAEVTRLVLLAPAFGFATHWPERLGAETLEQWRRTGSREVFHYAEARLRPLGYQLLEDGERYEDAPDFRQPALIFHGDRDDIVPVRLPREFAAQHPNVVLEVVPDGHEMLDVLDSIGPKVVRFLRQSS